MSRIEGSGGERVTAMVLDNAAVAQITAVNGDSEKMPNDPREPEVGFMVRVWQPHGCAYTDPGEGSNDDGTGHNLESLSFVIAFDADGAPRLTSLRYDNTNWVPELAESARQRRERENTEEAKQQRKREEAERLEARAAALRDELGGAA